jgi:hypothetical protein
VVFGAANAEAIPMTADHRTMVKYQDAKDPNFVKIVKRLRRLITTSAAEVQKNWDAWNAYKG